MKIALIGPVYPYRGGIAHHTTQLDAALQQHGHQVLLISFRRQYPRWLYPGVSDRDPSHPSYTSQAEYLLDPLYPWTWRQTARRIISFAPDLAILQWWTTFWSLGYSSMRAALRRKGIPMVYLIHNVLPHEKRPWDAWLARHAMQQGNHFICQNPHEAQRLKELLPWARPTISHLPVYPSLSAEKIPSSSARERLGLATEAQVLLFFGIVRPYKGLKVLLEALKLLRLQGCKPILIIAGEFWEPREYYQHLIHRFDLADQVLIDNRYIPDEEAHLYFAAADILVAPYLEGTQSGSVALALGYGLPVILTERIAGGASPAYRDHLSIVKAGDAVALAQAIQERLAQTSSSSTALPKVEDDWDRLVELIERIGETIHSPELTPTGR